MQEHIHEVVQGTIPAQQQTSQQNNITTTSEVNVGKIEDEKEDTPTIEAIQEKAAEKLTEKKSEDIDKVEKDLQVSVNVPVSPDPALGLQQGNKEEPYVETIQTPNKESGGGISKAGKAESKEEQKDEVKPTREKVEKIAQNPTAAEDKLTKMEKAEVVVAKFGKKQNPAKRESSVERLAEEKAKIEDSTGSSINYQKQNVASTDDTSNPVGSHEPGETTEIKTIQVPEVAEKKRGK